MQSGGATIDGYDFPGARPGRDRLIRLGARNVATQVSALPAPALARVQGSMTDAPPRVGPANPSPDGQPAFVALRSDQTLLVCSSHPQLVVLRGYLGRELI